MELAELDEIEVASLLEAIYQHYGYDFREYAEAHIRRRIKNRMMMSKLSLAEIINKVIGDRSFASQFLKDLSITVTEMFRDPDFYKALRETVIPVLKTYPFIKIWHAGCATGEEAYSMAIILKEEGLYDRTTIYATDFNQYALDIAREGIYSNTSMQQYISNYRKAGGMESFSDYYVSYYDRAMMDQSLKDKIVWANHNLVTDSVFAEVNMILCRNVMIYFTKELQNKVHKLFYDSLINGGILCLGTKESLRNTDFHNEYTEKLVKKQMIYQKNY
jgi:chemotaxis protein methyltransferase CheR